MKKSVKLWQLGLILAGGLIAWGILRKRKPQLATSLPNQTIYKKFAPLYDFLFGAPFVVARQRAVALLNLQAGDHLLVSGIGTGLDIPLFAPDAEVTGIDIEPEMLRQAAKKYSPANIHLILMDAQNLEFPAEYFDAALLSLIVSVAPDGNKVFQETWRTLKPGGRLVLFDKFAPEDREIGRVRSLIGEIVLQAGTDVNRKLSDITGSLTDAVVEVNEPGLFFGLYRILKIRKI